MLNSELKLKASLAIFCIYGLALPADKILQALELSILTWTNWFRNISPKLSRTYLMANDSLWVELICFSQSFSFEEQTSLFKRFKIKLPYPSSLASVNTRQVVNALGLNIPVINVFSQNSSSPFFSLLIIVPIDSVFYFVIYFSRKTTHQRSYC